MQLYLIVHPRRALTIRQLAGASGAYGHVLHAGPHYDPSIHADVVLVMPPDDIIGGVALCGALWPQLPATTGRMVLVPSPSLQAVCAFLQGGADDCQALNRPPLEILMRCGALVRRCAARTVRHERAVGATPCVV